MRLVRRRLQTSIRRSVLAVWIVVIFATYLSVFIPAQPVAALQGPWAPTAMTKVASRNGTTCAIADGMVYCWGQNNYGQLGNGTTTNTTTPGPVDTTGVLSGLTVTDVGVGSTGYACVVASGQPYCWGNNGSYQLGNGTKTNSPVPVAVVAAGAFVGTTSTAIAAGDGHVCVVASGQPYCWGSNFNGRTGIGTNSGTSTVPTPVDTSGVLAGTTSTAIEAGSGNGCVLASGAVYCWGYNSNGQLGNNSTTESWSPVAVDTSGVLFGLTVTALNSGSSNNTECAIASGAAYCWGANPDGQVGNGTVTDAHTPVAVNTSGVLFGKTMVQITEGDQHTCAIDSNGVAYCWGTAPAGSGSGNNPAVPVAVSTSGALNGVTAASIWAGDVQCVIGTNNRAYCWGYSATGAITGAIGDGTTTARSSPVAVVANDTIGNGSSEFYKNANSLTPGASLAAANSPAQLTTANDSFRLRYGVRETYSTPTTIDILPSAVTFQLQYATLTGMYCDSQTTGFAPVTTTTAIAWNTNSNATNGAQISQSSNDPRDPSAIDYQTYQSAAGNMIQTTTITGGSGGAVSNDGVWDFSLHDNHAPPATSYCLRITLSNGTPLDSISYTPTITTAPAEMSVGVVDGSGNTVSFPNYPLQSTVVQSTCQTVTGTFGTSSQQIQAYNNQSTTGWSLSVAVYPGPTSLWAVAGHQPYYDFNDPSGSPPGCNSGSDGDGYAGRLSIDPSGATVTSPNGCSTTGISLGSASAFNQSVTDSITLSTGSSSAGIGCRWNFTGVNMSQTIPAYQPPGAYAINMMVTMVAQ